MNRITPSAIGRGIAVAVVAFAAAAPSAFAAKPPAKPTADSTGCAARAFSNVFSAYQDNALYTLAPDGGFEAGAAGWTLSGDASVVGESSSIQLAALGANSLQLAPGATATTPAICVERGFPTFRFATKSGDRGVLRVQVLYANGRSKKTGRIAARSAWRVTRKLSLAQGRFHVKAGESANVQLRFTASRGTVRIDDVYVDPRYRG
jgi:hypothetical protein